jgi:hypothetical protein
MLDRPDHRLGTGQVHDAGEMLEVPGGLLASDDLVEVAKQPVDGLRRDVNCCARGDVVDDQGEVGDFAGDGRVPLVRSVLRGPRVLGRDDQGRVSYGRRQ